MNGSLNLQWVLGYCDPLVCPYLAGLHHSYILCSHQPLHPGAHCDTATSSSQHKHFVMLFGRGRAACVKIRDSNAPWVALLEMTQCSHPVSEP